MRRHRVLLETPGIAVGVVRCSGGDNRWSAEEPVSELAFVLVRDGLFRRRVDGAEHLADPVAGYVQRPGSIQQIAHPHGGDECTVIVPSRSMLGSLVEGPLHRQQVFVSPAADLAHRGLVSRAGRGGDDFELAERATVLAGALLTDLTSRPSRDCRPTSWHRYRRLVEQIREAIDEDIGLQLHDLASLTGVSAFHVSRIFRLMTGLTVTRYRIRLRLRRAIERLCAGERDLARIALDLGFSDQAHFTRALRDETGLTPGVLRSMLSRDVAASSLILRDRFPVPD